MKDGNEISRLIAVMDNEDLVILNKADIYYFEKLDRKTRIHTENHIYESNKSLNHFENILENTQYFRAHRSVLVNLSKVDRCVPRINYTYDLSFKEKIDKVPLSRDRAKILMKILGI